MNSIDRYVEYHRQNAINWEIDTHLDAAVYFANKWGLNMEQRCWLAFLTAICETTPTSLYLFKHFPDMRTTDATTLEAFAMANKPAMAFQYDVRWILYDIKRVFSSYKALIGRKTQLDALTRLAQGATPKQRWQTFTKAFSVPRFATYVFMLYTELLYHLCKIDMEATLDPRTNHSVRSGLIYAGGHDDVITCTKKGSKATEAETILLNITLNEIHNKVRNLDIEDRHKTTWAIETTLCTYNKTMHGRRYLGFYRERQRKEIRRLNDYTQGVGEEFDWREVWEYHNNWGKWNERA